MPEITHQQARPNATVLRERPRPNLKGVETACVTDTSRISKYQFQSFVRRVRAAGKICSWECDYRGGKKYEEQKKRWGLNRLLHTTYKVLSAQPPSQSSDGLST